MSSPILPEERNELTPKDTTPERETWAQAAVRRARYDNQDNRQDSKINPAGEILKGHGDRIRIILARETIRRENVRRDKTGVCHFGPDGSFVYTNEVGWGIPSHAPDQDPPYSEFNLDPQLPGDVTGWREESYGLQPEWSYQEEQPAPARTQNQQNKFLIR